MSARIKFALQTLLNKIPFFSVLSGEELSDLEKTIVVKQFSKNDVILLEDNTPNYMYIVCTGRVKVIQTSLEGKEHILAIHKQGDFFGEMSLLDGETAPASVVAMEDSDVGLLSKKDFEMHLLSKEKVVKKFNAILCSRLREAWLKLKVLSFADAEQKLRTVLKLLCDQKGIRDMRGTIIPLRLTHQDIADFAAVSRETVTRLIDKLVKDDEIEVLSNRNILLKPLFLKKILKI
jgi:CRP/FNR family cyclic AMP-dependent transcriptional regulator